MNVKSINPFERHVEKIVLAVAAVGAAYLIYLAFQPVVIQTDSGDVPIADIEGKVSSAIADLQTKAAAVERAHPNPEIPNFVEQYNRVANQRPLSEQLVAAAIPAFAPLQSPVSGINVLKNLAVVTPTAPAPTDTAAAYNNNQLLVGAPAQPGQPANNAVPKDVSWVQVTGNVPIGDLVKQFNDPKLKATERVPSDRQRALVVGIEVQRRMKLASGWGPWVQVQPSSGSNPVPAPNWASLSDADLIQTLNFYQNQSKRVLMPDYYPPATPTNSTGTDVSAPAPAPTPAANTVVSGRFIPPRDPSLDSGPDDSSNPPAAAGNQPAVTTGSVPFRFYDDSVEPGHLYQYQVRVLYYNPLYRFEGGLKEPATKDQPFLASAWVDAPGKEAGGAVNVESDVYFYVGAPFGVANKNDPKASIRIYKRLSANKWYKGDWTVQPGQPLSGPVEIVDKKPVASVDVSIPFTVVDVVPDTTGTQQMLILRDENGQLVERNSASDHDDPQNLKLEKNYVKPPPPPPTTTKPAPARGATPQPATPPSGGGRFVPPPDPSL